MVKYHMNRRDRKIKDESEPTNCEALKKYNSNIYKKIMDGFFCGCSLPRMINLRP